jgi:hypothetical protein
MTAREPGRRIAVLIDAENVSADAMDAAMAAARQEGSVILARAWRHWDDGHRKSWAKAMDKHGIRRGENVRGHNATDIALTIDAIDLLHERVIDGFCIVSNDRDYAPLAERLRRSGCRTIRMVFGPPGASQPEIWDRVVQLKAEVAKPSAAIKPAPESAAPHPTTAVMDAYRAALRKVRQDGGWAPLSEVGKHVPKDLRKHKDWLAKNGFTVETRPFGKSGTEADGLRTTPDAGGDNA